MADIGVSGELTGDESEVGSFGGGVRQISSQGMRQETQLRSSSPGRSMDYVGVTIIIQDG